MVKCFWPGACGVARALILVALPVASACDEATPSHVSPAQSIRPDTADRRRLEQVLRAPRDGADADSAQLATIGVVAVGDDGRIVVPQRERVVILDANGAFLRAIGRRGTGPGEFRQITQVGWLGDTLWLYDSPLKRITRIARSGDVLSVSALPDTARAGENVGFMGLLRGDRRLDKVAQREGDTVRAILRATAGGAGTVIATELASRNRMVLQIGQRRFFVPQPFGDQALVVASRDGEGIAVIERRVDDQDTSAAVTVRRIAPNGELLLESRYALPKVTLSDRMVDSAVRALSAVYEQILHGYREVPAVGTVADLLRRNIYVPRALPPVYNALAGEKGVLLLQTDREANRWLWLARNGDYLGYFDLPPKVRLLTATEDQVWGAASGEDNVPLLLRFRVVGAR